jgi:hypothetical protein
MRVRSASPDLIPETVEVAMSVLVQLLKLLLHSPKQSYVERDLDRRQPTRLGGLRRKTNTRENGHLDHDEHASTHGGVPPVWRDIIPIVSSAEAATRG